MKHASCATSSCRIPRVYEASQTYGLHAPCSKRHAATYMSHAMRLMHTSACLNHINHVSCVTCYAVAMHHIRGDPCNKKRDQNGNARVSCISRHASAMRHITAPRATAYTSQPPSKRLMRLAAYDRPTSHASRVMEQSARLIDIFHVSCVSRHATAMRHRRYILRNQPNASTTKNTTHTSHGTRHASDEYKLQSRAHAWRVCQHRCAMRPTQHSATAVYLRCKQSSHASHTTPYVSRMHAHLIVYTLPNNTIAPASTSPDITLSCTHAPRNLHRVTIQHRTHGMALASSYAHTYPKVRFETMQHQSAYDNANVTCVEHASNQHDARESNSNKHPSHTERFPLMLDRFNG